MLLQTSQIFLFFMARSKSVTPKSECVVLHAHARDSSIRVCYNATLRGVLFTGIVMILAAAFEFNPDQSPSIKKRPSDDMELSEVHNHVIVM